MIRRATLVAQETDRRELRGVMTDETPDTMSLIAQAEAEAEALEALMAQRIADADERIEQEQAERAEIERQRQGIVEDLEAETEAAERQLGQFYFG